MSQTLGNLIDIYSIMKIRRACAHDEGTIAILDKQLGRTRDEINQFYWQISSGQVQEKDMVVQPKLKNYAHQDNTLIVETKLGKAIDNLMHANITLWEIEDDRRDTSKTDTERLILADKVSIWNKTRNESIDQIDQILWNQASKNFLPPDASLIAHKELIDSTGGLDPNAFNATSTSGDK